MHLCLDFAWVWAGISVDSVPIIALLSTDYEGVPTDGLTFMSNWVKIVTYLAFTDSIGDIGEESIGNQTTIYDTDQILLIKVKRPLTRT